MSTAIVWFRRDLRLTDNPALRAALAHCDEVIPLYIHEPDQPSGPLGAASAWWLHHSLQALDTALQKKHSRLVLRTGPAEQVLQALMEETGATCLYWNRVYTPAGMERDQQIKKQFRTQDLNVESFNSALLREPWTVLKADGTPYRVFTPFWKYYLKTGWEGALSPTPRKLRPAATPPVSERLDDLKLRPQIGWDQGFYAHWSAGEQGAQEALQRFLEQALDAYESGRDLPAEALTSKLSAHLHFGEVSPAQLAGAAQEAAALGGTPGLVSGAESFVRELGWREFATHLLYHFPHTITEPLDPRYRHFPWRDDYASDLEAWQMGKTGIPLVDAGMRQLWETGWMHNRVRMIVASFLVKNLLVPWQEGEHWFRDTLLDADLASNVLGWQWVAGSGADAAPYFRIFNPVLQGKKFDPSGDYVRRWVPELAKLPAKFVHAPWEAPAAVLQQAGVELAVNYPRPLVDLKGSRQRALDCLAAMKAAAGTR